MFWKSKQSYLYFDFVSVCTGANLFTRFCDGTLWSDRADSKMEKKKLEMEERATERQQGYNWRRVGLGLTLMP